VRLKENHQTCAGTPFISAKWDLIMSILYCGTHEAPLDACSRMQNGVQKERKKSCETQTSEKGGRQPDGCHYTVLNGLYIVECEKVAVTQFALFYNHNLVL
jgi:hypothetical protein